MSITVVPFDDTLPAQFRDRVTHYLNCRVSGTGCDDVFSPVHATVYESAVSMQKSEE